MPEMPEGRPHRALCEQCRELLALWLESTAAEMRALGKGRRRVQDDQLISVCSRDGVRVFRFSDMTGRALDA